METVAPLCRQKERDIADLVMDQKDTIFDNNVVSVTSGGFFLLPSVSSAGHRRVDKCTVRNPWEKRADDVGDEPLSGSERVGAPIVCVHFCDPVLGRFPHLLLQD